MPELVDFIGELAKIDGFVAALITGIFTFLITKYTYHKNIPLDKYEKVYNRVYYPIYCLIKSDKCISEIVEQSEAYIKKYKKYVDKMTLRSLEYLKESLGATSEEKAYTNFKNNIYAMDTKLRKRLGYLEPNFISVYTYSQPSDKRILRIALEVLGAYVPAVLLAYIKNEDARNILIGMCVIFLLALSFEVLCIIFLIVKKIVKKLISVIMGIGKYIFTKIKLFIDWICRKKTKKRKRCKKSKK